jgi:hypothetical protein
LGGFEIFPDRQDLLGDDGVTRDGDIGGIEGVVGISQGVFGGWIGGFRRAGSTRGKKGSCGEEGENKMFHVYYF